MNRRAGCRAGISLGVVKSSSIGQMCQLLDYSCNKTLVRTFI